MTRPITNNPLSLNLLLLLLLSLLLGTLCQRGKKIEAFAIIICPCTFCINVSQMRPRLADPEKVQANQNIVAFYIYKKRPKQSKQVRVVVVSRQHGVIFCASLSRRGGTAPRDAISPTWRAGTGPAYTEAGFLRGPGAILRRPTCPAGVHTGLGELVAGVRGGPLNPAASWGRIQAAPLDRSRGRRGQRTESEVMMIRLARPIDRAGPPAPPRAVACCCWLLPRPRAAPPALVYVLKVVGYMRRRFRSSGVRLTLTMACVEFQCRRDLRRRPCLLVQSCSSRPRARRPGGPGPRATTASNGHWK